MFDLLIKNGTVFHNGGFEVTNIYLQDGKIALVSETIREAKKAFDAAGYEVLPGLIDPHVHFDLELGLIRSRDDFASGSCSAIYGGVTTIIDFLEPTSNAKDLEMAFRRRMEEAKMCHVDYHFHATIKAPDGDLEAYVLKMKELGMRTLKLFTTYSDSGRRTSDEHIIELLKLSKKHEILIMAHVENDDMIDLNPRFTYNELPKSRPTISEVSEALKLAGFVKAYGGYLYMVHLSSGATLQALLENYPDIINRHFFIESCPQYFMFTAKTLKGKNGQLYTCAPPLRSIEEVALLRRLKDHVYTLGTDHCAFNTKDKRGTLLKGKPLGIGGIEHSYNVMYQVYGEDAIMRMSSRVAKVMKLPNKGEIKAGFDADLSFFKATQGQVIKKHHGRTDYDLYEGLPSSGSFDHVMIRGQFVLKDKKLLESTGCWLVAGGEL
jgi:dihydropyrimidinase